MHDISRHYSYHESKEEFVHLKVNQMKTSDAEIPNR